MPVPAQHGHALKLTVDAMVHLRVAMTFHDPSCLRVVELLVTLANQDLASRDLSQLTRVCGTASPK